MTALKLAPAALIAVLGFAADQAAASYTGAGEGRHAEDHRRRGERQARPSGSSRARRLRSRSTSAHDGTADFSFDRSTFTAIDVAAGGGDDKVRIDQSGGSFADEVGHDRRRRRRPTRSSAARGRARSLGGAGNDVVDRRARRRPRARSAAATTASCGTRATAATSSRARAGRTCSTSTAQHRPRRSTSRADGPRVRFTRDVAAIAMDLDDVERIGFHALGGADTIIVDDLAGTDATARRRPRRGRRRRRRPADTVTANGTDGADRVTSASPAARRRHRRARRRCRSPAARRRSTASNVATLGGADTVTAAWESPAPATFAVDGGADADTVLYSGTAAADTIGVTANGTEVSTIAPATARVDATRSRAWSSSASAATTRSPPPATSRR